MSEKSFEDRMFETDLTGVDVTDADAIASLLDIQPDPAATNPGETEGAPPAKAAPAAEAAPPAESSVTPPAALEKQNDIAGVLTKDGKHVIPFSVLDKARIEQSLERQRADDLKSKNAELQKQVEDLKAGRDSAVEGYTPEQLADLEGDFPQLAPLLRTVERLQKQVANAPQAKPEAPDVNRIAKQEAAQASELDAALAPRALLSKYQATGGVIWNRAVEIDNAMQADPAFASKTMAERFAAVEQSLADELGIQLSTPNTQAAAQAAPARPRATPAPTEVMPTLTDFSGSGVSAKSNDPFNGASDGEMVDKAMSMNLNDLRAMVGLS
jgi:hypothetical protein